MNIDFKPTDELVELLAAATEGELDAEQSGRLNQLVSVDPQARDFYVQYMNLHGMLGWRYGGVPVLEIPMGPPDEPLAPTASSQRPGPLLAIAASLVAIASAAIYFMAGREQPAAVVLHADKVQWGDETRPRTAGAQLPKGRLGFAAGVARLQLESGVVVAIQGPAEFELLGGNAMEMFAGHVRAQVPTAANGFTIHAAGINVIDLGTEFGVRADESGNVEVHVFAGSVKIDGGEVVNAGEARRVTTGSTKMDEIELDEQLFPPIDPPDELFFQPKLVPPPDSDQPDRKR